MQKFEVYTDGSFGDNGEVHGGVVYKFNDEEYECFHVMSKKPEFVSMRNVGGEVLAAWAAITSVANAVKVKNNNQMDTYVLELVFDYKGIGEWLTGGWKTNKRATQWFVSSVREILSEVPNLSVKYIWVKGHSNTKGNHIADAVAAYDMSYCKKNDITICDMDIVVNL